MVAQSTAVRAVVGDARRAPALARAAAPPGLRRAARGARRRRRRHSLRRRHHLSPRRRLHLPGGGAYRVYPPDRRGDPGTRAARGAGFADRPARRVAGDRVRSAAARGGRRGRHLVATTRKNRIARRGQARSLTARAVDCNGDPRMDGAYHPSATAAVTFNPFLPAIGRVYQVLCDAAPAGATIEINNRDLAAAAGLQSAGHIPRLLRQLETKGYIERIADRGGSLIVVTDRSRMRDHDAADRAGDPAGDPDRDHPPVAASGDPDRDHADRVLMRDRSSVRVDDRSRMRDHRRAGLAA